MIHAAAYVAMEPVMDKQAGAQVYAALTKEQKANIAVVRKVGMTGW